MKQNIFFIGIGGIGMSAIARYFHHEGRIVAGYDRTSTHLTHELEQSGIEICYDDNLDAIPTSFLDKEDTLVIYTPAIPSDHKQFNYFKDNGFEMLKRSKILGAISQGKYVMAVAGTHGKSSTTTMVAYFNHIASTTGSGSAFLGAISKNFGSNLVLGTGERIAIEADEFDRSFLQLYPNVALVTAVDADHLDIYATHDEFKKCFTEFTSQIIKDGVLIYKKGIELRVTNRDINIYSYSLDDSSADFYARNIAQKEDGLYSFDLIFPNQELKGCKLGIPGLVNVENCIGAAAMLWVAGFDPDKLKEAMSSFRGIKRRFDIYLNDTKGVYIDDYAHHPAELSATLGSVRAMFPGRHITAIFQPHLYTRTRDFVDGFAESLSLADRVVLIPIYPARELPIEGVNSEMILEKVTICDKKLVQKEQLIKSLSDEISDILITFGAGDIDLFCDEISQLVENKIKH